MVMSALFDKVANPTIYSEGCPIEAGVGHFTADNQYDLIVLAALV